MPANVPAVVTSQVRAAVQTLDSLGGQPSVLAKLSDAQLTQIMLWAREGKSNEALTRVIRHHWGLKGSFREIKLGIMALRSMTLGDAAVPEEIVTDLDPLSENALLIHDLKKLFKKWNGLAMKTGDPVKLDYAKSIGKQLSAAIKQHAEIQAKLGKVQPQEPQDKAGRGAVNIGKMNVLVQEASGEGMPDFLDNVSALLESAAKPIENGTIEYPLVTSTPPVTDVFPEKCLHPPVKRQWSFKKKEAKAKGIKPKKKPPKRPVGRPRKEKPPPGPVGRPRKDRSEISKDTTEISKKKTDKKQKTSRE